jgi:hypothetical protein
MAALYHFEDEIFDGLLVCLQSTGLQLSAHKTTMQIQT